MPALAGGTTVALLLALVVLGLRSKPQSDQVIEGTGPGKTGVAPTPGLAPRLYPAQAWTGERLFVFGGFDPSTGDWTLLNDGALIDPANGNAEPLPAAPFDPPLWAPKALATGGSVFVVGHSCNVAPGSAEESEPLCRPGTYAAATFDLAKREWSIAEIPLELSEFTTISETGFDAVSRGLGATSDGRVVVQLGNLLAEQYWTYQPQTGAWSRLPDPGTRSDAACLANDQLVVVTTKYQQNGVILADDPIRSAAPGEVVYGYAGDGFVQPSLAILDLANAGSWRVTPPAEGVRFTTGPPRLACMGAFAIAVSQMSPGESLAVFDLQTGTSFLPAPPPISRVFNGEVWTGKELVFLPLEIEVGAPGEAYDPATNTWRVTEGFPPVTRGAIWSGTALVGYSEPLPAHAPLPVPVPPPSPPPGQTVAIPQLPAPKLNEPGVFRYVP